MTAWGGEAHWDGFLVVFPFAGAVWPVVIWVCWILVYIAWGDLCYAAVVPGSFGIVITAGSVHGGGLWDPFRRVWDLGIAVVMGGRCGFDSEVGSVMLLPLGFSSLFSLPDGEEEQGLGPWSVVVGYCGLMIFFAFRVVYLWRAHLCSASNIVHPVEVLGKSTSVIGSSHVLLDKL